MKTRLCKERSQENKKNKGTGLGTKELHEEKLWVSPMCYLYLTYMLPQIFAAKFLLLEIK
jgi:hypothetical protein